MTTKTIIVNINDNTPYATVTDTDTARAKALARAQERYRAQGYQGTLSLVHSVTPYDHWKLTTDQPGETPTPPQPWSFTLHAGKAKLPGRRAYGNRGACRSAAEGLAQAIELDRVVITNGVDSFIYLPVPCDRPGMVVELKAEVAAA